MKHKNISIFIPHVGCKNDCSFCNQRTISGTVNPPTQEEVREILRKAFHDIHDKSTTEIAFFGGSFTAINHDYMISLLQVANEFIGQDKFTGIRISTRPDAITQEILSLLKKYHVTAIELGAQSMIDDVLSLNDRGHTAEDVRIASKLIQQNGFALGLQMMVSLYGDTQQGVYQTANEIIAIKPDTVRIYPTVILRSTKLAKLYEQGLYEVMPLETAVSICADLLSMFTKQGIKAIKLGLHASNDVEKDMVGGIYHPAFRELCESEIYYKLALNKLMKLNSANVVIEVSEKSISKMIGQKKINMEKLRKQGYCVKVTPNCELNEFEVICRIDNVKIS